MKYNQQLHDAIIMINWIMSLMIFVSKVHWIGNSIRKSEGGNAIKYAISPPSTKNLEKKRKKVTHYLLQERLYQLSYLSMAFLTVTAAFC